MLANEHASVTLSSLVYDPAEGNLLVAAFTVLHPSSYYSRQDLILEDYAAGSHFNPT